MPKILLKKPTTSLKKKVFDVVRKITRGSVLTYKEVAKAAGAPAAFRVIGNILSKNYDPKIPCHRVIRADGKIGGYNRGTRKKIKLLKEEGVNVIKGKFFTPTP